MAIRAGRTGYAGLPAAPGTGASEPGPDDNDGTGATRADDRRPTLLTNARGWLRVPGTGQAQRWFFSGIWLIYLISPVAALFGDHHSIPWIAGGLVITIAFSDDGKSSS